MKSPRSQVCNAALEVYVRRAYTSYDITCLQHLALSGELGVVHFQFVLPTGHPNRRISSQHGDAVRAQTVETRSCRLRSGLNGGLVTSVMNGGDKQILQWLADDEEHVKESDSVLESDEIFQSDHNSTSKINDSIANTSESSDNAGQKQEWTPMISCVLQYVGRRSKRWPFCFIL
ncbi:unnamed protein product, partial [Brenthis ino]